MYVFELVFLFPSGKYPEVELLSHMVVLFLIFLHNLYIVFHIQFSRIVQRVVFDSLRPHRLQHARLLCPSPTLGAYSNLCPSSQ